MRYRSLIPALLVGACTFAPAKAGSDATGPFDAADAPKMSNLCTTACPWGCLADPTPHCGQLVPGGGAVDGTDFAGNMDLSIDTAIDTGDGMNMKPKIDGTTFNDVRQVAGITIFRGRNVHITGDIAVVGKLGLAIVASGTLQIDGVVAPMDCMSLVGGYPGGGPHVAGGDPTHGGGAGGATDIDGGGGGGNGGAGGPGGTGAIGGLAYGAADLAIAHLTGGGGGGGGGGGSSGGRGGPAIQLVSNAMITGSGGVAAGGCGGNGSMDHAGGGGGAGGTILLEAPTIALAGVLVANGGGGGAGTGAMNVRDGADGRRDRMAAAGGIGTANGGAGGAASTLAGSAGLAIGATISGGGGGGVGRIRIETASGIAQLTGTLSPSPSDQPTTTTVATATVR